MSDDQGVPRNPKRKPSPKPSPSYALVWTFAGVIVAFFAATAFAQYRLSRIDAPAVSIATDIAPSVERLATARAGLRHLQATIVAELERAQAHEKPAQGVVQTRRAQFQAEVRAYLMLPKRASDQAQVSAIEASLARLDPAIDRSIDALAAGKLDESARVYQDEVEPAADAAATAMIKGIERYGEDASELAAAIERTRKLGLAITIALHAAAALAAVFALWSLLRLTRSRDRLAAERTELLARKADELEAFASRVAHDLLNPLTAVLLNLDRLAPTVQDERQKGAIERCRAAAGRARRLIDDLLGFARAAGTPEPGAEADLASVARDVIRDFEIEADRAGVKLSLDLPPQVRVRCPTGALTSVIGNLLRNAIKFRVDGSGDEIVLSARVVKDRVHIEVVDQGPGIPEELRARIFLPHVRAPSAGVPGLGLGLATVRRLVEAYGGEVGVRSQVGEGSAFWFELPLPN